MDSLSKSLLGIATVIGLAVGSTGVNAQTNLRLAVETTPGDPLNVMLTKFRDELQASATSDELTIEFFDGGSLGDEIALMEMVRVGEVQVVPLGSDVVQLDKQFAVFETPLRIRGAGSADDAVERAPLVAVHRRR